LVDRSFADAERTESPGSAAGSELEQIFLGGLFPFILGQPVDFTGTFVAERYVVADKRWCQRPLEPR
jgi:hypothetical protein